MHPIIYFTFIPITIFLLFILIAMILENKWRYTIPHKSLILIILGVISGICGIVLSILSFVL
ncbi:hypothetical protein STIUS_v1c01680 [Spiroplasma sp. TIUS-1]|nr:hypothetical protein STIUS_v1c01680 [Spiroplasma sp. TIUS-1]